MFKNKSIVIKWIISYCIILTAPIFISIIPLYSAANIINDEIITNSVNSTVRMGQRADSIITDVNDVTRDLSTQQALKSYIYSQTSKDYNSYELMSLLYKYKQKNYSIENIYLYSSQTDTIVSSDGYSNSKIYFDNNYKDKSMTIEAWQAYINNALPNYYAVFPSQAGSKDVKCLAMIKTIPVYNDNISPVKLIVTIDLNSLLVQSIDDSFSNEATFLFMDNSTVLSTYNKFEIFNLKNPLSLFEDFEFEEFNYNKKNYIGIKRPCSIEGFSYVYFLPAYDMSAILNNFYIVVGIYILLCIIIGYALIVFVIRKNYTPIKNIVSSFKSFLPNDNQCNDEFDIIKRSCDIIISQTNEYSSIVYKQNNMLRDVFLQKILLGKITNKKYILSYLEQYNIDLPYKYFAVIQYYPENLEDIFFGDAPDKFEENYELTIVIIKNIVCEICAERGIGYCVDIDNTSAVVFNINSENITEVKDIIVQTVDKTNSLLKQHFNLNVVIGVSDVCEELESLSTAYRNSLSALEYGLHTENSNITYYDSIPKTKQNLPYIQDSLILQLVNEIKADDIKNAQNTLDCLSKISDTPQNVERDKKISDQIIDYVNENYYDTKLNVNYIAEHFDLTSSYISRIFKQETGESLLSYVNSVRIKNACILLTQTNENLEKIANKTGFSNTKTFIRVFNKFVGTTPGQYRDNIQA